MPNSASWVRIIGRTDPSRPAITCTGDLWTYSRLAQAADSIARLVDEGIDQGEPVGIVMSSSGAAVAGLLACKSTGRSAVLLPPKLPPEELSEVVEASGIRSVLLTEEDLRAWDSPDVQARTDDLLLTFLSESRDPPKLPSSIIQLTSGSLGPSRLAVRPWRGVATEIRGVRQRLGLRPGDRVVCASSIAHSYGLIGGLLAPLSTGSHIVFPGGDVLSWLNQWRPTCIFGLAGIYRALLESIEPFDWQRDVRFLLSAGAPLPPLLFEHFLERTGIPIRQDYGTTETGTIAIDADPDARPKTVGRPLDHITVRLREPSDAPLEGDELGEIQVRSAATARGYLVDRSLVPCVDTEGWYHTRDAGALDHQGALQVRRRLRPPIVVGNIAVRPEHVERVIAELPGIREVAVVPIRGESGHTGLKAIVATDVAADSVRHWCNSHLPVEARPTQIERRDALPRSPAGKVLQKYML